MARVRYDTDPVPGQEASLPAKVTERQREYLLALLEKKDLTGVDEGKLDTLFKCLRISEDPEEFGLSKLQASKVIDWLLKRADKPQHVIEQASIQSWGPVSEGGTGHVVLPDVPAGRYAVENEQDTLRFYTVDRPTQGRWAGYTFVSVWASDEKHPIRGTAAKAAILAKIMEQGVQKSAERFGQEIGACGICGRTLTDPLSRELGIGPICREKSGWY